MLLCQKPCSKPSDVERMQAKFGETMQKAMSHKMELHTKATKARIGVWGTFRTIGLFQDGFFGPFHKWGLVLQL